MGIIRRATIEDLDTILAMALKAGESTGHNKYFKTERVEEVIRDFLISDDSEKVIFLYEDKGFLAAMKTTFPFGIDPIANEISWWVEPEARLKGAGDTLRVFYEVWAEQQGCKFVMMSCLDPSLGDYYINKGYKLYVQDYIKEF